MAEHCPTCGGLADVVRTAEGTAYYTPLRVPAVDCYLEPRPYVAANLRAALDLVTDTGDWHGQLREWAEAQRGDATVNPGLATVDPHRERLEDTIRYLAQSHHDTIRNSKLHDPEARTWEQCDCKTCVRAQEALGISRPDRAAERFLNIVNGEEDPALHPTEQGGGEDG